jgi:hypothetical protein
MYILLERRGTYRVLIGKPEGRRTLGRPNVEGSIILKWILRIEMGHGLDRCVSG